MLIICFRGIFSLTSEYVHGLPGVLGVVVCPVFSVNNIWQRADSLDRDNF